MAWCDYQFDVVWPGVVGRLLCASACYDCGVPRSSA